MKILGYQINEGEYKGIAFKNIYLYVEESPILKNGSGIKTDKVKIKYDFFCEFLNENNLDLGDILGLKINVYFNKYNSVEVITLG